MIQAWGWHESRAIRGGTEAPGADRVMENPKIVPLSGLSSQASRGHQPVIRPAARFHC